MCAWRAGASDLPSGSLWRRKEAEGRRKRTEKPNTERTRWMEGVWGGLERKRKRKKKWEEESRKGAERGDRRK